MSHFSNTYINGTVVRWKSNDAVPFEDVLKQLYNDGLITLGQMIDSNSAREKEANEFLFNYRKQMETYEPSDEEMFEMRSAFGECVTVVNAISGKRVTL